MSQQYIHYGNDHFDKNLFNPIRNNIYPSVKPEPNTGLWGCPVETNEWKDFAQDWISNPEKLDHSFIFELKPNSNILYVRNENELQRLKILHAFDKRQYASGILNVLNNNRSRYCMDFENCMDFEKLVCMGFDAMEVHIGDFHVYYGLYGWDIDSILVLNPDCVIERTTRDA